MGPAAQAVVLRVLPHQGIENKSENALGTLQRRGDRLRPGLPEWALRQVQQRERLLEREGAFPLRRGDPAGEGPHHLFEQALKGVLAGVGLVGQDFFLRLAESERLSHPEPLQVVPVCGQGRIGQSRQGTLLRNGEPFQVEKQQVPHDFRPLFPRGLQQCSIARGGGVPRKKELGVD